MGLHQPVKSRASATHFCTPLTAAYCNTLQHTAHCSTPLTATHHSLQHIAYCNSLQHTTDCSTLLTATHCNSLHLTASHCNTLLHIEAYLKMMPEMFGTPLKWSDEQVEQLQLTMTHHALQHTATHCNTLQRTATHCNTQAYLDVMPETFGTPLNWSDEQVAQLQFPKFMDELRVERSYFGYEVVRLRTFMPDPVTQVCVVVRCCCVVLQCVVVCCSVWLGVRRCGCGR